MSDSRRVTCGAHGDTPATFGCRHLARGVACGYHCGDDGTDDPWPDAWCDLCEEAVHAEGGEWSDASEKVAEVTLMCAHCYDEARERNVRPPPLARGARTGLTAKESDALFHHAVHEIQAAQETSHKRWGWNAMANWDFDPEASTLTFSDPARPTLIADVRIVGSYSTRSNTFQWAWQTFDECTHEADDVSRLRIFGEVRGIPKLTTANWKCQEAEGWK